MVWSFVKLCLQCLIYLAMLARTSRVLYVYEIVAGQLGTLSCFGCKYKCTSGQLHVGLKNSEQDVSRVQPKQFDGIYQSSLTHIYQNCHVASHTNKDLPRWR